MGLFNKKELRKIAELEEIIKKQNLHINSLETDLSNMTKKHDENLKYMQENKITDCQKAEMKITELNDKIKRLNDSISAKTDEISSLDMKINENNTKNNDLSNLISKQETTLNNLKSKIKNLRSLSKDIQNAIEIYHKYDNEEEINYILKQKIEDLDPTVELKLNCLNMKELRKKYKENEKNIETVLDLYQTRYTTKANQTIYKLMVIGLKAELQNTLLNLKYEKEAISINYIHEICEKYRIIASEGNQSIAKTINKFIAEIEVLFNNAIHIEYEYYVQKERQRAEQAEIREKMRQEAEERKLLEQQRKQVEKEESKYHTEMNNVRELLANTEDKQMIEKYLAKIEDLQRLLEKVENKKEEIINRQNGKAGNVYVISNLGSFGENVFKVGMTRRLEPMDRIKELSSASVPFEFDVHAMIFSEDAVNLENKLHHVLDQYRLNKINLRKEFFKIDLDLIEEIVLKEDPAADFNRTMIAEEYRQSLSIEEEQNVDN